MRTPEDTYEAFWAIMSNNWTAREYLALVQLAELMDAV